MSVSAFPHGTMAAGSGGLSDFSPTVTGQQVGTGSGYVGYAWAYNIYAWTTAYTLARIGLWVIQTSTNCYVRVGGTYGVGTGGTGYKYYYTPTDSAHTLNYDYTGLGDTMFALGEQCDTVTIDHTLTTTDSGFTTGNVGSTYTDASAFAPTQDTKYGRYITDTQSGYYGVDTSDGEYQFDITFSKSGYNDYSISFAIRNYMSYYGY